MKKLLGIVVLGLLFSNILYAEVKPMFPFTIDDQITTYKDGEEIIKNKSNELISDEYWNKPLTKLDYYIFCYFHIVLFRVSVLRHFVNFH